MLWVQTDAANYHMAHHYGDAKIVEDTQRQNLHPDLHGDEPVRHYPQGITIATDGSGP